MEGTMPEKWEEELEDVLNKHGVLKQYHIPELPEISAKHPKILIACAVGALTAHIATAIADGPPVTAVSFIIGDRLAQVVSEYASEILDRVAARTGCEVSFLSLTNLHEAPFRPRPHPVIKAIPRRRL